MPSALTPKVPLTVVANQVIVGMATTVQVGACEVLYIYLGSPILAGSPLQPTLNYWGPQQFLPSWEIDQHTVRGFFIVPKNLFVPGLWDGDNDLSVLIWEDFFTVYFFASVYVLKFWVLLVIKNK